MFVDLNMFASEKSMYQSSVNEIINYGYPEDIQKIKLDEAEAKYKNSIRKYLSVSINKINEIAGGTFSLYKVGKDLDANFKVIEGKVRKSKQELIAEFNNYQSIIASLDERKKKEVLTAMNVIVDYSDDKVENNDRETYLNG
ncbi:MAG: hypothetical protein IKN87_01710 [Bacilli bacterium]|nr:hypothetical protein [Bacilli bacterium]